MAPKTETAAPAAPQMPGLQSNGGDAAHGAGTQSINEAPTPDMQSGAPRPLASGPQMLENGAYAPASYAITKLVSQGQNMPMLEVSLIREDR